MQPDLKTHRLPKLIKQQGRNFERSWHLRKIAGSYRGVRLQTIQGTKKRSVGKSTHQPTSPASSSSRIACTSSIVKTRSPQFLRNRAMMSTFGKAC